jgi:hypothetical protein
MTKKRLVLCAIVFAALALCFLLSALPAKPLPNVRVRILGVSPNAAGFVDWNVAVTKVTDRPVNWFITIHSTNRGSVIAGSSVRWLNSVNLPRSVYEMGEEGHIAGPILCDTSQVYCAIGMVSERSKLLETLSTVAATNRAVLKILQIMPEARYTMVTSEWVELNLPKEK